ncbi:DUF2787 domain-containing protein [Vibrio sp. 10N.286.51.C3]|uniref:DUF2787 family protein n=1 Tax=unclassified Vibrio TaxID=2614977 RepID=UPI000D3B122B|nr:MULTISPECIES: DUF2787 family protein [unclassified Vibrio]PTP12088.1 DUF2787 domain-containing protein [Vibrio sp. 10N.286.51.C3]TKE65870.1 DUF2787 domain-containing protein [Vibrio sp. F12]
MTNQPQFEACSLSISRKMKQALGELINKNNLQAKSTITFNFRDKSYSAESGGYHPIEISLLKRPPDAWAIEYITDFAYMGNVYPELERSVDFDISNGASFFSGVGWQSIDAYGVNDFYTLWESNFLSYLNMDSYDNINITSN